MIPQYESLKNFIKLEYEINLTSHNGMIANQKSIELKISHNT